jgi:type I restriction enzyme S subunit
MSGEWIPVTLSDIADLIMGQSPAGDTCNEVRRGIPLLNGPTEFGGNHPIPVQYTTDPRKFADPGDLLFCVRGSTTGRMNWADQRYAIGRGLAAIRAKAGKDYRHFIRAVIDANLPQLLASATGSTFPNVSRDQLQEIECVLPPLPEQRAIASVLGALDDKIELNRRMNATLEAMARALFQSWFVDFDPVRAKLDGRPPEGMDAETAALFPASFQDSELGHIPKGWEVKPLSELCTLGRGASPRPINDYMNGEVPWVKIADATAAGGPFLFETKEKVKKAGAEKSVAVAPGDLILSNSATCGVPIFVELHGCIHDGWLYFKNLRSISKLYLFHVLIELAEHLVHIADGSVQKNLNTNLVGQQNVLVPPKEIVDAFDAQATVWFAKMRQNGLESRTLATLQDTLLPKLLSGELSLAGNEMLTEAATNL